jgi:hypothetical protein
MFNKVTKCNIYFFIFVKWESDNVTEENEKTVRDEDSVFKNNRVVEKIRDKNRRLSNSIWTDEPVLKPKKSIWADEDTLVLSKGNPSDVDTLVLSRGFTSEENEEPAVEKAEPEKPVEEKVKAEEKDEAVEPERKVSTRKEFSVNIPPERYKEYEKPGQGSRPLRREEVPERKASEPKQRTQVEIISDKLKAEEYARRVQVNSAMAKRMVSISVPVRNPEQQNINNSVKHGSQKGSAKRNPQNPQRNTPQKHTTEKTVIRQEEKSERLSVTATVWICAAVCAFVLAVVGVIYKAVNNSVKNSEVAVDSVSSAEEVSEVTDESSTAEEMLRRNGNLLISGSGESIRGMTVFEGGQTEALAYGEAVEDYETELEGCNVYNMCVPLSSGIYLDESVDGVSYDPEGVEEKVSEGFENAISVDVCSALEAHKDEYIYSRTDSRWQPLGAYYAAKVFAEKAGVSYIPLGRYEAVTAVGFTGDLCSDEVYGEELSAQPDTFTYYKPQTEYTATYYDGNFENGAEGSMFFTKSGSECYDIIMDCSDKIVKINTSAEGNRTLVIFTDGTANAFVPFLTSGFSEIYVCNFDSFNLNGVDFCNKVGCTDLLFAVSDSFCAGADSAQRLDEIRER